MQKNRKKNRKILQKMKNFENRPKKLLKNYSKTTLILHFLVFFSKKFYYHFSSQKLTEKITQSIRIFKKSKIRVENGTKVANFVPKFLRAKKMKNALWLDWMGKIMPKNRSIKFFKKWQKSGKFFFIFFNHQKLLLL